MLYGRWWVGTSSSRYQFFIFIQVSALVIPLVSFGIWTAWHVIFTVIFFWMVWAVIFMHRKWHDWSRGSIVWCMWVSFVHMPCLVQAFCWLTCSSFHIVPLVSKVYWRWSYVTDASWWRGDFFWYVRIGISRFHIRYASSRQRSMHERSEIVTCHSVCQSVCSDPTAATSVK